jgi:hypothetical protein
MGISAKKLVYDFRRKFNSVNSGRNQDIALVDIIAYLNEAQEIWFENRVFVAQTNEKVRNDLRVFKKDKVKLSITPYGDGAVLAKYPTDLYKRLNHLIVATKSCCPEIKKEIIPRIIQSDDLHEARHNPFRRSDFFFEQLNAIETVDGLVLYHDNEFEITDIYIDYYRRPGEIHAPTLEECEGDVYYDYAGRIITKDQDFEVDATYAVNEVVDISILKASRDVSDIQGMQSQINLILSTQDLHK